jgi:Tfp pilus assembly protein PilN
MKPKTKTLLFILLSFLLGIICGWFLEDRMFNRMQFHKERNHGGFLKVLNERLHLDERQMAQVDSILESRKQKMEIYRKNALAMRDTTRVEIRKILDFEQTKLFDDFNRELDNKEAKKWEHGSEKK